MNKRFETLLRRYLAKMASPAEVAEFLRLANEPENKALVEKQMDEHLQSGLELSLDKDKQERVLETIHSNNKKGTSWPILMAAASLVIVAAFGVSFYLKYKEPFSDSITKSHITISGKDYVQLPDGSSVALKEGSTLIYSKSYGVDNRELTLSGEAFFDVAHNEKIPFKVHTGSYVTTVLGTAFNIKAYDFTEKVIVTVARGKVAVGNAEKIFEQLIPNEQLTLNTISNSIEKSIVNADEIASWKDNYFILNQVTIGEAAEMISQKFHVDVNVTNDDLKNCEISCRFVNNETLEEVLSMVTSLREAEYKISGDHVTITGGTGCAVKSNSKQKSEPSNI